jgi:hypothetical protein
MPEYAYMMRMQTTKTRSKSTMQKARVYLSEISKGEKEILLAAAWEAGFTSLSGWIIHVLRREVRQQTRRGEA